MHETIVRKPASHNEKCTAWAVHSKITLIGKKVSARPDR